MNLSFGELSIILEALFYYRDILSSRRKYSQESVNTLIVSLLNDPLLSFNIVTEVQNGNNEMSKTQ